VPTFRIREAADLIGVSDDTLRRWADGGRIETTTDTSGRLAVDGAELARFACELAEQGDRTDGRAVVGRGDRAAAGRGDDGRPGVALWSNQTRRGVGG